MRMKKMLNEGNQIHNSGNQNYDSGSAKAVIKLRFRFGYSKKLRFLRFRLCNTAQNTGTQYPRRENNSGLF
jgi:hypothetical protein